VSHKAHFIGIDCYQIQRELSDYLEGDVTPQFRLRIEEYLRSCDQCNAVYDGLRNIVQLLGHEETIELPKDSASVCTNGCFQLAEYPRIRIG